MMKEREFVPTDIKLHQRSKLLEISFEGGDQYKLPCEYLRVYSPAAEVRTLEAQGKVETGKENVNIKGITPVGSYAIQLTFDDGHDSGVYSWKTLHSLGEKYEANWLDYLARLERAGYQRNPVDAASQEPLRVKILYFVTLVKLFGKEQEDILLPASVRSVGELLAFLRTRGEKWEKSLADDGVTITLNKQFVDFAAKLWNGDEIAIVPTKRLIV